MAIKTVNIPLFDDPFYDLSVTLEGQSYILEFTYVGRLELYFLSIYTSNRTRLLSGAGLVPNYPIIRDYAITGLSGYFVMQPIATDDKESYKTYPDKINEYYKMKYVYEE